MHAHLISETVVTQPSTNVIVVNNVPLAVASVRGAAAKPRVNLIITNTHASTTFKFKLDNAVDCTSANWDFCLAPGERIVFDNWRGKVTVQPTPTTGDVQVSEGF